MQSLLNAYQVLLELKKKGELTKAIAAFFISKALNKAAFKKNKEYKFDFEILDSYQVFGKFTNYDFSYLVGSNWLDDQNPKPIAMLFGFNDWKYGFISKYLNQYRTAFSPLKLGPKKLFFLISLLLSNQRPSVIFVWGYTDGFFLKSLFILFGFKVTRVEDGFVRSAGLGAEHETPYSLVFDQSGLYYDSTKPSDIETILNNDEFFQNEALLDNAKSGMRVVLKHRITKYKQARVTYGRISKYIKSRPRVLVIGQVDGDQSLKRGNPERWNSFMLLELAWIENPGAEILYRPHPEVYRGFQKSKLKQKQIAEFGVLVSPEEDLIDILDAVDHVYVITSLSGLEALIRGIKVTVVGAPFYAGWGLTDDRLEFERRKSIRTLPELFAGCYLLYPKYLANLSNSAVGLEVACLRINADYIYNKFNVYKSIDWKNEDQLRAILNSEYWPQIMFANGSQEFDQLVKRSVTLIDFTKPLKTNRGRLFQLTYMYSIVGKIKEPFLIRTFLNSISTYIDFDLMGALLIDIKPLLFGSGLADSYYSLLTQSEDFDLACEVYDRVLKSEKDAKLAEISKAQADVEFAPNAEAEVFDFISKEDAKSLFNQLVLFRDNYEYDRAIDIAKTLFLSGHASSALFIKMAELAEFTMDKVSARQIASFQKSLGLPQHNGAGLSIELENIDAVNVEKNLDYLVNGLFLQLKMNPDRINRSWAFFKFYFNDSSLYQKLSASLSLDSQYSYQYANAYLEIDKPEKARDTLEHIANKQEFTDREYVAYSKTLFALGEHDKALNVINEAISRKETHLNFTEHMRLLKSLGRFEEAYAVYLDGNDKKLQLTRLSHELPIMFGLKRIEDGFKSYLNSEFKALLMRYFGKNTYKDCNQLNAKNLLLISAFGPAEEIRYAVIYNEYINIVDPKQIKITCDYRLFSLMQRSFPTIKFIPVKRTRYLTPQYPHNEFDLLPSADLHELLDNNGVKAIEQSDEYMLVCELLWHFRKKYDDFLNKSSYLVVESQKAAEFKARLPTNTMLVGLCWRSSLTNSARNVHYLKIQELEALFSIPEVTYVNFQYDECSEDLQWVNERYPGKLINFEDIDHFNDLDSVAALMCNMEFIISPLTTVIELAGALGCKGLVFSNHGEAWWREVDSNGTDAWYQSVVHVRTEVGNKKSLAKAVVDKVSHYMDSGSLKN